MTARAGVEVRRSVEMRGAVPLVPLANGQQAPVTLAGRPHPLGDGWACASAFYGLAPHILLSLVHANGARATWVLDEHGGLLGGALGELEASARQSLLDAAAPVLLGLLTPFLCERFVPGAAGEAELIDLSGLERRFALELFEALAARSHLTRPRALHVDAFETIPVANGRGRWVNVRSDALRQHTSRSLMECYLEGCQSGIVRWASPVDGRLVANVHSFAVTPHSTAWRCFDDLHALVYFVFTAGHEERVVGTWVPSAGLFFVYGSRRFVVESLDNRALVDATCAHFLAAPRLVSRFLRKETTQLAHYTWSPPAAHIGHYVLNEMTGLAFLAQGIGPEARIEVHDLGGATGSDFFGPIDAIFPEIRGLVRRKHKNLAELSADAYRRQTSVLRFSGGFVSRAVRERLARQLQSEPALKEARKFAASHKGPVVVFGLRVENRTLTDLAGFFIEVARVLEARFGSLAIVFDGHNRVAGSASGETYASYLEHSASRRPVDIEREVVEKVKAALVDREVRFVSCVGMTPLENLAWMSIADYCVAPWGAGLAKVRWVLDLPCFILVNNECARGKGDLRLYDSPEFVDSSVTCRFVETRHVVDRPDAELLVQPEPAIAPFFVNYDVDVAAVAQQICEEVAAVHRAGD